MRLQRFSIKVFDDGGTTVTPADIVPVFHGWIQQRAFDELLIDVGDYKHVPGGPGAILVGLQSDYSFNDADGAWGLTYTRKRDLETEADKALESAIRRLASAASRLQDEPDLQRGIHFDSGRLLITFLDRLAVPNSDAGLATAVQLVERVTNGVAGAGSSISPAANRDRRGPLKLAIRLSGSTTLKTLAGEALAEIAGEVTP